MVETWNNFSRSHPLLICSLPGRSHVRLLVQVCNRRSINTEFIVAGCKYTIESRESVAFRLTRDSTLMPDFGKCLKSYFEAALKIFWNTYPALSEALQWFKSSSSALLEKLFNASSVSGEDLHSFWKSFLVFPGNLSSASEEVLQCFRRSSPVVSTAPGEALQCFWRRSSVLLEKIFDAYREAFQCF